MVVVIILFMIPSAELSCRLSQSCLIDMFLWTVQESEIEAVLFPFWSNWSADPIAYGTNSMNQNSSLETYGRSARQELFFTFAVDPNCK
jgi:hypothetical protein